MFGARLLFKGQSGVKKKNSPPNKQNTKMTQQQRILPKGSFWKSSQMVHNISPSPRFPWNFRGFPFQNAAFSEVASSGKPSISAVCAGGPHTVWKVKDQYLHPGRLTWNLQITHLEGKMIFQTSMIMFHVNLQGCKMCWLKPEGSSKSLPSKRQLDILCYKNGCNYPNLIHESTSQKNIFVLLSKNSTVRTTNTWIILKPATKITNHWSLTSDDFLSLRKLDLESRSPFFLPASHAPVLLGGSSHLVNG